MKNKFTAKKNLESTTNKSIDNSFIDSINNNNDSIIFSNHNDSSMDSDNCSSKNIKDESMDFALATNNSVDDSSIDGSKKNNCSIELSNNNNTIMQCDNSSSKNLKDENFDFDANTGIQLFCSCGYTSIDQKKVFLHFLNTNSSSCSTLNKRKTNMLELGDESFVSDNNSSEIQVSDPTDFSLSTICDVIKQYIPEGHDIMEYISILRPLIDMDDIEGEFLTVKKVLKTEYDLFEDGLKLLLESINNWITTNLCVLDVQMTPVNFRGSVVDVRLDNTFDDGCKKKALHLQQGKTKHLI